MRLDWKMSLKTPKILRRPKMKTLTRERIQVIQGPSAFKRKIFYPKALTLQRGQKKGLKMRSDFLSLLFISTPPGMQIIFDFLQKFL